MTDKQRFFDHRTGRHFWVDRKDLFEHWDHLWAEKHPDLDGRFNVPGDWTADRVRDELPRVTADLQDGRLVECDLRPGTNDLWVLVDLPDREPLEVLARTAAGSLNGDRPLRVPR